jgi:putative flippase GtrA
VASFEQRCADHLAGAGRSAKGLNVGIFVSLKRRLLRLIGIMASSHIFKFLVIGVLSFAIDLGTLTLLKEFLRVDLWIATPIAFIVSLVFNFWAQRVFTFRASNNASASFLNVNMVNAVGFGYAAGKVCATIATMAWNFLLYKYWIFRSIKPVVEVLMDEA